MKKIKIDILSAIWFIFIIYSRSALIIPIISAIFIHELGHIIASIILKVEIKCITISILGARLEMNSEISYLKEFIISLSGPTFGFLAFLLTSQADIHPQTILNFSIISLALSIFNLLPIETLDGGRIVKCLLCSLFSLDLAEKIMQITTFFTLFSFWLISVYIMLKFSGGLSAFIFCSFFFAKCFIFGTKKRDLASF